MFIGDGGLIASTWLRSSSQLYRSAGLRDGKTESTIWQAALFGALLAEMSWTEEDDAHSLTASQPAAAVINWTEEDDAHSLTALTAASATINWAEEDDVLSAAAVSGFTATVNWTEEDDVHDVDALHLTVSLDLPGIAAPTPVIGPSEIAFGFGDEPIDLDLDTIPAPPLPTGPLAIRLDGVDDVATVYAHLYDTDGVTFLAALPEQFALSWQDVDSETGAGQISVPMIGWNDATGESYETDWALLTPGRVLRCFYEGYEAFTWVIGRQPTSVPISEDEEGGMIVIASGRGWSADLDTATIYPPWTDGAGNPLNNPLNPSQRAYTFASDDYPRWNQWPAVQSVIPYTYVNPQRYQYVEIVTVVEDDEDIVEFTTAPAPLGFPVTTANWIWPTADTSIVGKAYMRQIFGIGPGSRPVSITATADNFYTLYLNGTPIFGEIEDSACWREYKTIEVVLPAGYHTLAVVVENIAWAPPFANPGGFIAAVYETDADGQATTVWCQTDEFWTGLGYPSETPGFTPAEVIFNMVYSAQVRGQLPTFDFDFTATHDSAGAPWPYIPGIGFNVGDKILGALTELHRQRWVDWRIKPGSRTLQMWNYDTGREASGALYTNTVDIRSLSVEEADAPVNRLLVKWTRGYFTMDDLASQVALGKVFEDTLVVDTDDIEEAERRGEEVFAQSADPKPSILLEIEPLNDTDKPYVNYGVRDTVTSPYVNLAPAVLPVVSISVTHDDEGKPRVTLELQRRMRILERDDLRLLQQLGSGIVGSLETSDALTTVRAVSLVD